MPAFAEQSPHPPGGSLGEPALSDTQFVQGHPIGVQQPGDVVIRRDEQGSRIGKRFVVEQQVRVDVTVRADQRKLSHRVVQAARHRSFAGVEWQQPIRMQRQPGLSTSHAPIVRAGPDGGNPRRPGNPDVGTGPLR